MDEKELKSVTMNTGAYNVSGGKADVRSEKYVAEEDMHIVALEHFTGVIKDCWSDNGHMLSKSSDNPWASSGPGMEKTGTKGYFGYNGRDYYGPIGGVNDVMFYESFPSGTYFFVKKGETIYLHCFAAHGLKSPGAFHHCVRLLYW